MAISLVDAKYLQECYGIPVQTWAVWRTKQIGPPWVKLNRLVRYDLALVDSWIAANTVTPADA
ncbi:hypothetical protein G4X40_04265 [Rhodococcus sp. D2-41]|uniref:DNA-binding protein n=1 Tax=Speluncibacter jeojiensis TaxID=2710754 RepID=A0A9X4MAQ0_9ACTN|nr:DNA-binding protein [Rhodococcus sp. D2-41]MDG3009359.1 hypothetical protein [Rhodococcus sp. D2-41]MDG3017086.1 DNA-binding protein [Corynebacteriales bacterium D3-21]